MTEIVEVLSAEGVDTLAALARDIWNEYFPFLLLGKFLSRDALLNQMNEGYEFYFLVDEDGLAGFTAIHPEKERLFLSKIYLKSDKRDKGYSNAMFDFVEKRAKELGLNKIYLTVNKNNEKPIAIYKHKGYNITDAVVTDIGNGFVMDDYIFEKQVGL